MEKIRVYYNKRGNTLNVRFDNPKKEYVSEETGDEVILAKDKKGKVIGFEKLNFLKGTQNSKKDIHIPVELSIA